MASRRKGRILAFQSIYAWEANGAPVPPPDEYTEFPWEDAARLGDYGEDVLTFSRLMVRGTMEHKTEVDRMIRAHLAKWAFSRVKQVDLAILRLSVYTLMFQPDIHPSITISEAVGIALEFGSDDSFRFINGVLDSVRRSLTTPSPNAALPGEERPSREVNDETYRTTGESGSAGAETTGTPEGA